MFKICLRHGGDEGIRNPAAPDIPRKTKAVKRRVVFSLRENLHPSALDGFSIARSGGDTQLASELRHTTFLILGTLPLPEPPRTTKGDATMKIDTLATIHILLQHNELQSRTNLNRTIQKAKEAERQGNIALRSLLEGSIETKRKIYQDAKSALEDFETQNW